jgi:hypothetical protein
VVSGREIRARVILIVGMLAVGIAVAAFANADRASQPALVLAYDEPTAILLSGSLLLGLGGALRRFLGQADAPLDRCSRPAPQQ